MLAQTIGTGVGIAGGTAVGGPPGGIAGGAAGSVLGKKISRLVMGGEQPDIVESGIDAGLGALGPAASTARNASRALAGEVIGGGKKALTRVKETGEALKGRQDTFGKALDAAEAGTGSHASLAHGVVGIAEAAAAKDKAFGAAVNAALKKTELTSRGVNLLTAATAVVHDPVSAVAVFAGGHALRSVQKSVAERALRNEKFVSWALARNGIGKPAEIATSLTALAAEKGLTAQESSDLREIALGLSADGGSDGDDGEMSQSRPQRESSRPKRLRDERTGQFMSPRDKGFSYSALSSKIIRGDV